MLDHALEVVGELADEAGDVQVGVGSVGQGEVVGFGQDFDTVWEDTALAAHTLLERSRRSAPNINLSIKQRYHK